VKETKDTNQHHHTNPPKGEKKLGTMRPAFIASYYNENLVLFFFFLEIFWILIEWIENERKALQRVLYWSWSSKVHSWVQFSSV
jgi:hypothetical protein